MTRTLNNIDHAHLTVSSKTRALDWYTTHLRFERIERLIQWDTASGPLMLRNHEDNIHLALFERETLDPVDVIAFGTSATGFLAWKSYFDEQNISTRIADHDLSFSLYFSDPFGNGLEITTYDVVPVRATMNSTL